MFNEHYADEKLKDAKINSLKLAEKKNLKSITFPAISTGIFGYPQDKFALIILSTTIAYLEGVTEIEKVVFYLNIEEILKIFTNTVQISRKNLK
jgi:O-acetyl-ADP-ribose deacetylase (regulator of RNase III)